MKSLTARIEGLELNVSDRYFKLSRALKLKGLAESTIRNYLRGFRRVCEYFNRLPDNLMES
jgi:hypothetical protein